MMHIKWYSAREFLRF